MRYLLASAFALAVATPALADDYYVIREESTKECRVVSERPRETTWVQVGDIAFKAREEADERVKVLCRDSDDDDVVIHKRHVE